MVLDRHLRLRLTSTIIQRGVEDLDLFVLVVGGIDVLFKDVDNLDNVTCGCDLTADSSG